MILLQCIDTLKVCRHELYGCSYNIYWLYKEQNIIVTPISILLCQLSLGVGLEFRQPIAGLLGARFLPLDERSFCMSSGHIPLHRGLVNRLSTIIVSGYSTSMMHYSTSTVLLLRFFQIHFSVSSSGIFCQTYFLIIFWTLIFQISFPMIFSE